MLTLLMNLIPEPVSKRFTLVKIKAGEDFNRMNLLNIYRINHATTG